MVVVVEKEEENEEGEEAYVPNEASIFSSN